MLADSYELLDQEVASRYGADPRWMAVWQGLNQLRTGQLVRILTHANSGADMVCDSYNYDVERQLWCPLAIGLGVPDWVDNADIQGMTNELAKNLILRIGRRQLEHFSLNPLSGVPGRFFRNKRHTDVGVICRLLILERKAQETSVANWNRIKKVETQPWPPIHLFQ